MKKPTIIAALAAAAFVTGCQTDSNMETAEASHMRSDVEVTEAAGADASIKVDAITPRAEVETRSTGAAIEVDSNIEAPEVTAEATVDADADGPAIGSKLEDLPAAAQATIREKAAGAAIADIDKEERTGQVVYEVSFKDEGLNPKIHVGADGRLISEEEAELFHNEAAGAQPAERINLKREVRGGAEALKEAAPANIDLDADADVDVDADADDAELDVDVDADVDKE